MIIEGLTTEQKDKLLGHIKDAIYYLASCWDCLREAEEIAGREIETDDIEFATGNIGAPSEAFGLEWEDVERIFAEEE